MSGPLLTATGMTVRFGGVTAVAGVDLQVEEGRIVGLIGPNGAGKTTMIDALTGFVPADGRVRLGTDDLAGLRPDQRASRGLVRTWQGAELFDDLTVAENVAVALPPMPWRDRFRRRPDDAATLVADALDRLEIGDLAESRPRELTEGRRKLVGVARALAARPRVVCLDEPAAGLDPQESRALGRVFRRIAESGVSFLLVEHDVELVTATCDAVTVLEFGRVIAQGTPAEVTRDPAVVRAYLGAPVDGMAVEES